MARVLLAVGCLLLAGAFGGAAGCAADQKYSQTELNALETREFDASFERTFDAVVAVMIDTGRTIYTSDKRGGLIGASGMQIKVEQLAPSRTSVRVSTSAGGQIRVDKQAIDDVLHRVDRRLTSDSKPPSGGGARGAGG